MIDISCAIIKYSFIYDKILIFALLKFEINNNDFLNEKEEF